MFEYVKSHEFIMMLKISVKKKGNKQIKIKPLLIGVHWKKIHQFTILKSAFRKCGLFAKMAIMQPSYSCLYALLKCHFSAPPIKKQFLSPFCSSLNLGKVT